MSEHKLETGEETGGGAAAGRPRFMWGSVGFVWGGRKELPGRWYAGLFGYYPRAAEGRIEGLAISLRGLSLWGAAAVLLLYAAGAAALHRVWQRNPYSTLTYSDALLLPVRRAEVGRKQGQAFLSEGMKALERKQWQVAISRLQLGLARCPEERGARAALAWVYYAAHQREHAVRVMAEGAAAGYPGREYLETYFAWLEETENFPEIAALAERFLRDRASAPDGAAARWLAQRRTLALVAAGRHEDALAAAEAEGGETPARERQVSALLALNRPEEALARLEAWRPAAGADLWRVTKLQAQAWREAGQWEKGEAAIEELRRLLPGEIGVPVFRIIEAVKAGRTEAARASVDDFIFRFGGSPENLRLAAKPLAELGDPDGVRICLAAARERGHPAGPLQVLLVQALLTKGEWSDARAVLASVPEPAVDGNWRGLIAAVIEAALSPAEALQRRLEEIIRNGKWRPRVLRETAAALLLADRLETARDVLRHGARAYPHVAWFGEQEKETALRIQARSPAAGETGPEVADRALNAEEFGPELDRLVRARRWDEAARLIRRAYGLRPAPEWLAQHEPEVRLAQARIAQARSDRPALLLAARLYLNGETDRAERLLGLARGFLQEGDAAAAVGLAEEIVRRMPSWDGAEQVLTEWAARVPEARASLAALAAAKAQREQRLLAAELRRKQEAQDPAGMQATVRNFLNGGASRRQMAAELAEDFRRRGDTVSADVLLQEVQRSEAAGSGPGGR